jgi:hypothetical protein
VKGAELNGLSVASGADAAAALLRHVGDRPRRRRGHGGARVYRVVGNGYRSQPAKAVVCSDSDIIHISPFNFAGPVTWVYN